ncbi:glycine C-acetyltransferase [Candidatus Viadribacter manganicus]|uniref:2-amino-3-ketobutyrate coenzyme A ligase n=1 Tax=Candidatus Viadribacter manganicus TaxID=1759059 RepID=A0A1B1ALZ2_9PROT|nr:glycine C-acetyltransferase [Candidatus Viadribacter manganicus]ANP47598.1 2-amino-3-ketobutyrate CoA ligase [Candidatus Viadribacter manganicus]
MYGEFQKHIEKEIASIREAGFYKEERVIATPQGAEIGVTGGKSVINMCANNYLGLAQDARIKAAAHEGLDQWGYGMASVRFICGTQTVHKQLEDDLSKWLQMEDTILYPSCFDANGGLFEVLLGAEDAIISDELNHASIIDGVRLCKAQRYRYKNNDMNDLEAQLKAADAAGARFKLISTDGVFSMDGVIASLDQICDLAERYNALVHVDDSHSTGIVGPGGRGTAEYRNCIERLDILTSTLGKALGGASGGFTSAKRAIVELLRQRSRPYLFSNTVPPPIVAAARKAVELAAKGDDLRKQLKSNMELFRNGLEAAGFDLLPGEHPIIPVMLYDAKPAVALAEELLKRGVYVIAFSYPVVPKGKARIRTQMSAAHTRDEVERAVAAFAEAKAVL